MRAPRAGHSASTSQSNIKDGFIYGPISQRTEVICGELHILVKNVFKS